MAMAPAMAMSMSMSPVKTTAAVVMIHGGGYSMGERSDGVQWDRWFAARGYPCSTLITGSIRPCRGIWPRRTWPARWSGSRRTRTNITSRRIACLITGQSAGGGLALQVAYGLGDGTVTSSCGGTVPQPKAVFALYPPEDFVLAWNMNTGLSALSSRDLNTGYIGGSPEQFSDRYAVMSPVFHVRPGLPPTLIAAGAHDHLVPFEGHVEIMDKLNAAGVPVQLLRIPVGEHGYDLMWGGIGGQVTRKVVGDFLEQIFAGE